MQIRIKNGMTRLFFAALGIFLLSSAAVVDASTVQYRYDELDRLYQAEYSDGTVVEYIYDNVDNRIAMSRVGMALTFSAYPPSPQGTGVQVTFTALVTGGTGPYEYEFQARFPGGTFGTVRNYSTDNTWTWNTTGSSGGGYEIRVNVRNAGSTAPFEARTTIAYTLTPPVTGVTLTPSLASPQAPGTSVTWTASASGGSGSYEYMIQLYSPTTGAWSTVKDYTVPGNTWAWDTTGLAPGSYIVDVWARNAGSTAMYEAYLGVYYVLQ